VGDRFGALGDIPVGLFGGDRFRNDVHVVIAALTIKLDDVHDIALHECARQRTVRPGLNRLGEVGVLDLLIALEADNPDRWIFGDVHQDAIAGARNLHVFEQASRIKPLEPGIELAGVESPAGAGVKIGADHVRADVAVAVNRDRGIGRARRGSLIAYGPYLALGAFAGMLLR